MEYFVIKSNLDRYLTTDPRYGHTVIVDGFSLAAVVSGSENLSRMKNDLARINAGYPHLPALKEGEFFAIHTVAVTVGDAI
jgi:hypothetical protein